jgi:membrane associated rhomboid family serine protease
MPYRLLNPGSDCVVGADREAPGQAVVACGDTPEAGEARELEEEGAPLGALDQAAWWVTILTSMFMHGGILHIAFNMLFLWIFGNNVEDSMGRLRFLVFYLLAGIAALYAQTAVDPDSTVPTIGASGAVAGVLGAYLLLLPRAKVLTMIIIIFFVTFIEIPAYVMLGIWFVLQFLPAVGQVATPDVAGGGGVAYFAHVGGFIFGLLMIRLFAKHRPVLVE